MLLFSKCSYVGYKKNRSRTGDSCGEYTFIHIKHTSMCTHTHTHTYANNKELHRHRVTLETLTNKHICAHRHMQARAHTCLSMFIYKLSVTLTLIKQKESNRPKHCAAQTNMCVRMFFCVYRWKSGNISEEKNKKINCLKVSQVFCTLSLSSIKTVHQFPQKNKKTQSLSFFLCVNRVRMRKGEANNN